MSEYASLYQKYALDTPSAKMDDSHNARVLAITSGKGGVGKTNITTNLGIALASQGMRVCIFDADTNLANINILLGITPEFTLEHFLSGEKTINEVLAEGPRGIKIIPAASGIADFSTLESAQKQKLINALEELESQYDYLLIDTAAGIGDDVLSFIQSAQHTILVISPEPTSLTDAFSLLKTLKRKGYSNPVYVMVNMVLDYGNSVEVYSRFEMAADKYLHLKVHYLGYISLDESVISSVRLQQPVIIQKPESPASRCFNSLATGLKRRFTSEGESYSFSDFWKEQLIDADTPSADTPTSNNISDESTETAVNHVTEKSLNLQQLSEAIETFHERGDFSEETSVSLIQTLIMNHIDNFDTYPLDVQSALFHALEIQDFPISKVRDLTLTLESLYERRSQQPLHSQDEVLLKLLEDSSYSENHLQDLYHRVQSCFKRRFNIDIENSEETLTRKLKQEDFTEQHFSDLIEQIKTTYQERFDKPYLNESDILLKDISQIADQMLDQEAHLHDRLTHLTEILSDTVTVEKGC